MYNASKKIYLVLHNIRSLHNVGSIFRTADAAGIYKIFLTGYTPTPVDLFGNFKKEVTKTALGAEKTVLWAKQKNISLLFRKFKAEKGGNDTEKFFIAAIEQGLLSIDYKKFKPKFPLVLVLGNEVRGLSKHILKKCDAVVEIPMKGKKESLNVAVAAGIVLFRFV